MKHRIKKMISFELGKEIAKNYFRLVTSVGQIKKIKQLCVPMRNPRPGAVLSSQRGSMVSEARYEYMKQIKITYVNRLHPMISCTRLPNSGHLHVRPLDSPELLGNYFIVRETISNFHALEMEADRLIGELRIKL